jgi:TolB protein
MHRSFVRVAVALASVSALLAIAGSAAFARTDVTSTGTTAASDLIVYSFDWGPGTQLYLINSDGSGRRQLTSRVAGVAGVNVDVDAAWSPKKQRVAFSSNRWAKSALDRDIFVIDVSGTGLRRLAATPAVESSPSWSPDGREIVFSRDVGHGRDLFIVTVATGKVRRLTQTAALESTPAWSPDGEWIAFVRAGRVWAMHPAGTGTHPLHRTGGIVSPWAPDWSPSSQMVVAQAARTAESPTMEIWVIRINGMGGYRVTSNWIEDTSPVYSPSGTRIAFCRGDTIWTMRYTGWYQRTLTGGSQPDW